MDDKADRFLANKWTVLDRLTTLRALARHFSDDCYADFDKALFERLAQNITDAIADQTAEVKKREGRP